MNVLIIEDEPFAQQELQRLLVKTDHDIHILDMIDSVEDAVDWLKENNTPDLIFLDIQLADGLSFEIFKRIEVNSPVVFTTAYDQYAIQAFELNSIDYLLKPIEEGKLQAALNKLKRIKKQFTGEVEQGIQLTKQQLHSLLNLGKKEYKSRFLTRIGNQIKHISTKEIAYFFAEDNVVFLMTHKNEKYIIDHTIEEVNRTLNPNQFYRLNRAFITHINAISKVHKYLNSRLKIELIPKNEKEVLISRKNVADFLDWMEK